MSDETNISFDDAELIQFMLDRGAEEYARKSDAGESGAKTSEYLETTGLNSQAFSWGQSILKKMPKKDGALKAMDIIRSLEALLPVLKSHVNGQQSEMNLDSDNVQPINSDVAAE